MPCFPAGPWPGSCALLPCKPRLASVPVSPQAPPSLCARFPADTPEGLLWPASPLAPGGLPRSLLLDSPPGPGSLPHPPFRAKKIPAARQGTWEERPQTDTKRNDLRLLVAASRNRRRSFLKWDGFHMWLTSLSWIQELFASPILETHPFPHPGNSCF